MKKKCMKINKIWDSLSGRTSLKRKIFQDFFVGLALMGQNHNLKKILKNIAFQGAPNRGG